MHKGWLPFGSGVGIGWILVWISPLFFGTEEPWESGIDYLMVLLLAGALLMLISPRRWWLPPCGLYIGQLLDCLSCIPDRALPLLGYTFAALVAAFLGALEYGRLKRQEREKKRRV